MKILNNVALKKLKSNTKSTLKLNGANNFIPISGLYVGYTTSMDTFIWKELKYRVLKLVTLYDVTIL